MDLSELLNIFYSNSPQHIDYDDSYIENIYKKADGVEILELDLDG